MKLDNNKFTGVLSIVLIGIAFLIGLLALIPYNIVLAIIYGILFVAMPFIVAYSFCIKCPCNGGKCPHIIFGKITKLFKPKQCGKYKQWELSAIVVSILSLVVLAQFAIITNCWLFAIYWVLLIISVILIRLILCPKCKNKNCPLNNSDI